MKIRSYEVAFIILLILSIIIPPRIRSCHFDNTIKRIPEYTSDVNVDLPVLPELQHFSADQHDFLYMGYMDLKEYEEEFSYVIDSISFLLSEGNCDPDYYSALFDELPAKYDEDYSDWFKYPEYCNNIYITKEFDEYCSFVFSIYEDVNSLGEDLKILLEYYLMELDCITSDMPIDYISDEIVPYYNRCVDLCGSLEMKLDYICGIYDYYSGEDVYNLASKFCP